MTAKDITDARVSLQLYPGYTETDTQIFAEFINPERKAQPGFLVDFLGSRIRTTSVWKEARTLDGQLIDIPVPADFHSEAIEWIGLLKSVRGATDQYVAMELGAGFGPWAVAGGVAARLRGIKDIRLCAVEGDAEHFQFLRQHFVDNDFEPDRHLLLHAAVGMNAGVAQWPIIDDLPASESWGSRLIGNNGDSVGQRSRRTKEIEVIPVLDLVIREPCWDLIHIDVQGDEVDICRSCIDELNARVRWIIVGTHSRKIEGDLLELMCHAGWLLEHEKPVKFSFVPNSMKLEEMTTVDGTQVWRNPRFVYNLDCLTSFSHDITSSTHEFRMRVGASYTIEINVKNTGTEPWVGRAQITPINASYRWLDTSGNVLPFEGSRTTLNNSLIRPGENIPLKLQVVAPPSLGLYTLCVSMVQEGVAWFCDQGAKPLLLQVIVS